MDRRKFASAAEGDGTGAALVETPDVSRHALLRKVGTGAVVGGALISGWRGLAPQEAQAAPKTAFPVDIIYSVRKSLSVTSDEKISDVKAAAMALFGIPAQDANNYVLRMKIAGRDQQLDENATVAQVGIKKNDKITLASAAPFG